MRKHLFIILFLVILLFIAGCAKQQQAEEITAVQEPTARQEVRAAPRPETPASNETPVAPIKEQKQLATGGATDIKQENITLLSEVVCKFGEKEPEKFSFKMTNTETKRWMFSSLSYSARETADNPVIVLNALQITNGQLIESCGRRSLSSDESVTCDFDLTSPTNLLVKKNLRIGETAMGNVNENTLSLRTTSHAAHVIFLCE
ncbi:MAG: hypothetical protein KKD17_00565 [Nanoarchaeota archaeon]|nr:hypothetical protein [Nanoarchaeota archaeon]